MISISNCVATTWATFSDGSFKLMDPSDITLASTDASVIQVAAASSSTYAMARVPVTGRVWRMTPVTSWDYILLLFFLLLRLLLLLLPLDCHVTQ